MQKKAERWIKYEPANLSGAYQTLDQRCVSNTSAFEDKCYNNREKVEKQCTLLLSTTDPVTWLYKIGRLGRPVNEISEQNISLSTLRTSSIITQWVLSPGMLHDYKTRTLPGKAKRQ